MSTISFPEHQALILGYHGLQRVVRLSNYVTHICTLHLEYLIVQMITSKIPGDIKYSNGLKKTQPVHMMVSI